MEKHGKKVHEDAILLKKDDTDHWLWLKFEAIYVSVSNPTMPYWIVFEIFLFYKSFSKSIA